MLSSIHHQEWRIHSGTTKSFLLLKHCLDLLIVSKCLSRLARLSGGFYVRGNDSNNGTSFWKYSVNVELCMFTSNWHPCSINLSYVPLFVPTRYVFFKACNYVFPGKFTDDYGCFDRLRPIRILKFSLNASTIAEATANSNV